MKPPRKFRALLATMRVANLPSVASNVWVGAALAVFLGGAQGFAWAGTGQLVIAACCVYLTGTFLNDWMDQEWDAEHRPERALPARLFAPRVFLVLAIQFAVLGLGLAAVAGFPCFAVTAGILALVVCYTVIHKRTPWSVVPMGLCRAGLPLLGASGVVGGAGAVLAWAPALALFCYVAGLSLAARAESVGHMAGWVPQVSRLLFAVPVFLTLGMFPEAVGAWAGIGIYGLWLLICYRSRPRGIPGFVSLLLAGIPLVDGLFLLPLAAATADVGFAVTCLLIPLLGVAAAMLLQRLAPAT